MAGKHKKARGNGLGRIHLCRRRLSDFLLSTIPNQFFDRCIQKLEE
tara:strand:+ start:1973 stop:2110 length:138 start_codon:yes stop_codon:yes gene_type:complete